MMRINRTDYHLTNNWKFILKDCEEAWYMRYDDSDWENVLIPHDWAVGGDFSKEYSSGTGYLRGGIGWYRGRFTLGDEFKGKSISLHFDGVYKNSQVWVNSYYLGKRPSGYVPFSYDITPFVKFGEENVISVKVSHTDIADSRWYTGSGIFRKVFIRVEETVHPVKDGVFVSYKDGVVKTLLEIENSSDTSHEINADVIFTLCKKNEKSTSHEFRLKGETVISPHSIAKLELSKEINDISLWSVDSPSLYKMDTLFSVDGGEEYIADTQKTGFRVANFDPDCGFTLNGKSLKINGVCVHHDAGAIGAAVTSEIWARRLLKLKECGCNAIRTSHNPHMPELYELCDYYGFLMMDEAFDEWENAKNKWSVGHNVYPPKHQGYFEDFPAWHETDLRAMIRRDRNHPSVIMYSIGNEIDYPNDPYCHPKFTEMTGNNDANKPAKEREYDSGKPNTERLSIIAGNLSGIIREEDSTRYVTLAAAFPELSSYLGYFDSLDVVGYNYKEQFYKEDHLRFPNLPILGSENSHSYEAFRAVHDNDFISGQFLWTGIDYLGEAHGWPIYGSHAGMLTTDCYERDRFFFRKTLWNENLKENELLDEQYVNEYAEKLYDTAISRDGEYNDTVISLFTADDAINEECFDSACERIGYIYQLEITVRDSAGKRLLNNDKLISVGISGAGCFLGMDNGSLCDLTRFDSRERKTFEGHSVLYVRRTAPGRIIVNITVEDEPVRTIEL